MSHSLKSFFNSSGKVKPWAQGWATWLLAGALIGASVLSYVTWIISRQGFQKCMCDLIKHTRVEPRGRSHIDVWAEGRQAKVYVPAGGLKKGMGVVFVLHGSFDSPQGMYGLGFEPIADERGFLVIYPTMSDPKKRSWAYTDDLTYFVAIVGKLIKEYEVNADKTFVCGHSSGGTMSLFLQNEVKLFAAAGAVEAGVGDLQLWHMNKRGTRTMVIWNHGDPVLEEYGGEELYRNTITTLRRGGDTEPSSKVGLPTSRRIVQAELQRYKEDAAPPLTVLSFRSEPGTHNWPGGPNCTFDGAGYLVSFFFDWQDSA